jgi:integrase/recombinase XerC
VSPETKRTYASKVRGFLAWLADADLDGDPLTDPKARDWAIRDWRAHLLTVDNVPPPPSTTPSPPSTISTPAGASARPAPSGSTCPPPRRAP